MIEFDESYFEAEYRDGFYIEPMMKRAWAAQLEIVQVIDMICKKHGIKYFADLGTLLGTVRHRGFIPWDDDLDLGMMREDYQKFLSVVKSELPEGYDLLNVYEYPDQISYLSRVVNSHEIRFDEEYLKQFHGFPYVAGVDIFVTDYIPRKEADEKLQCELINIVKGTLGNLTLENPTDPETLSVINKIQTLCGVQFNESIPVKSQMARLVDKLCAMYTADEADEVGFIIDLAEGKDYHISKDAYAEAVQMPFENIMLPVPVGYDEILKKKYGENYMTPMRGASSHGYPFYRVQQKTLVEHRKRKAGKNIQELTICVIARNAEKTIEKCLQCLQPYDVEIVVVDMDSSDRTRELANKYTLFTYCASWVSRGTAKKNAILNAQGKYAMVIHADEYVASLDIEKLIQMMQGNEGKVGRLVRYTAGAQGEQLEYVESIFATETYKEKFTYMGNVEEYVVALDGSKVESFDAPVTIVKADLQLSEEECKKQTEERLAMILAEIEAHKRNIANGTEYTDRERRLILSYYYAGKHYYDRDEYELACKYFSEGLEYDVNPKEEYVIDMVECYGYALLNSGQAGQALLFENIYEEFGDSADFKFLMGLIYLNNDMLDEAVAEFLGATEYETCRKAGANSYLAYYNVGVIYECCGMLEEAKEFYGKCGDYEPAVVRLQELG